MWLSSIWLIVLKVMIALSCAAGNASQSHHITAYTDRRQIIPVEVAPNIPPSELKSLHDLYNSTNGNSWQWLTSPSSGIPWVFDANSNPCDQHWQGVFCTSSVVDGYVHVVELNLISRNLVGSLPLSFGNFSYLQAVNFGDNGLTGGLPTTLRYLSSLLQLMLNTNQLNGSIPMDLFNTTRLEVLYLNENQFTGPLPELANALQQHSLTYLLLHRNHFNGTIHQSYCSLAALQVLNFANNDLSGSIPDEIGQLMNLTALSLSDNYLFGRFPDSMAKLVNLQFLYLDFNGFYGPIPAYFGNLTSLGFLSLGYNYLTETIPHSLSQSNSLVNIYLAANELTGTISPSFGQMKALLVLNLHRNRLTGSIPLEIGNIKALKDLLLYENKLTGSVPSTLTNLVQLQYLDLSDNYVTGTIPAALGLLTHCVNFKIHKTQLTGSIPSSIGGMTSLDYLSLHNNHLTSTLPHSISQMERLNSFFVFNNLFTGSISGFINATMQRKLQIIEVSGNRLTGQLPDELFKLPQLQTLAVVSNCFEGSIPASACNSTTIQTLALDGLRTSSSCQDVLFPGLSSTYVLSSRIKGGIPTCLFEIPSLNTLHLSGNGLTSSLPNDVNISPNLVDISISHNKLTGTIPRVFQERIYYNFDLSYNKFTGTLTGAFATVPGNLTVLDNLGLEVVSTDPTEYFIPSAALSLRNNRLSHVIPPVVQDMLNLSVLQGNLFGCHLDKSDLPRHDNGRGNYQCGSAAFDIPYYVFVSICFCLAVLAAVAFFWRHQASLLALTERLTSLGLMFQKESCESSMYFYRYIMRIIDTLCKMSLVVALYIVVVLTPVYAVLSRYYGTHTYEYAWSVSGAFFSGEMPFAVLLVFYALLTALVVWLFCLLCTKVKKYAENLPALSPITNTGCNVGYSLDKHRLSRLLIYAVFLLVNLTVVVAVNFAYVWVALYAESTYFVVCQVAMSIFKLAWNNLFTRWLARWSNSNPDASVGGKEGTAAGFFSIQLLVMLFNYIAVPCIVVAATSPNCFANIVVTPAAVSSYFLYNQCTASTALFGCLQYTLSVASTTYDPPFTYSYQCSASIVTYYGPAFVYLGLFVTFGGPLLDLLLIFLSARAQKGTVWFEFLIRHVPKLLRVIAVEGVADVSSEYSVSNPYFKATNLLISVVCNLGIMMTFGVLFPPLAVVMLLCICSTVWVAKLKVTRFLHVTRAVDNVHPYSVVIDNECRGVGTLANLRQCMWQLISIACLFYTLFLFDTLGDAVSLEGAYWVLIVVPLLPLCIYLCLLLVTYYQRDTGGAGGVEMKDLNNVAHTEREGGDVIGEVFNVLQLA